MASEARVLGGPHLARLLGSVSFEGPHYVALAQGIRSLLLEGRIPHGTRLPAERVLAASLGVSRTTVTAAYDLLRAEGHIESRRGSGSWTALPTGHTSPSTGWGGAWRDGGEVDLGIAALPAPSGLAAAVERATGRLAWHVVGHGYDPAGLAPLREAVAEHYTGRGLPTTPEQILVTNGALHAFVLVLRLLVSPGDGVLVDSPTYPAALGAARHVTARLVPVGMTDEGWDLEVLKASLCQSTARLAYTIADFHNPTGRLMSDEERSDLVAAARRAGAYVVVDETFVDLALDPVALPAPVAVHDPDGRVVTIGSASKLYWGGLRVGWIRTTPPLVRRLAAARAALDIASPVLDQLVASELLAGADAVRAERRAQLTPRRGMLARALRRELPGWRFAVPSGGLFLWVELDEPVGTALTEAAAGHRLRLTPGPMFGTDGTLERYLRLPFVGPPEVLAESVRRLAAARREVAERGGPRPSTVCI